jgi:aminoglycoside phosphotransferase (APT) family kinase protein
MLDHARPRVLALLDWELATLGDPLADLGYLVATYTDAGSPPTVLDLSPVTRSTGFPTRAELVERYAERSGRGVGALAWYEVLALWKAAVFCEGLYGRYLRGESADRWTASLAQGVPGLLDAAAATAERG